MSHLKPEERDRIAQLHTSGHSQAAIGRALDRPGSTIGRELTRNGSHGQYCACEAQRRAVQRRRDRPLVRKVDRPEINAAVRQGLAHTHSPDEIAQRLKVTDPDAVGVSATSIYRWIKRQPKENRRHWQSFLRRRGKRPYRRRAKPRRDSAAVANRPQEINDRLQLGHFEGDLVLGKPGTGGLLTLVERRSRYTFIRKVTSKQARHVRKKARLVLQDLPEELRRSLSLDNGTEFALFETLEELLGLSIYWCQPGCPYQRGTNENTNGLIRQFFPKGTDFRDVSHHDVRQVQILLNDRPRACIDYWTPDEVFFGKQPPRRCI